MSGAESFYFEDVTADSLVFVAQTIVNGSKGYSFRMTDGTYMFVPTPSDEEVEGMWKNITTAVYGNEDFFLYYRSLINMTLITEVLTKTEGVDQPTLILRFQDGFQFNSPYESMVLMQKDYAEFLSVLSKLNVENPSTVPRPQLH